MAKRKRRKFNPECKAEVVRLVKAAVPKGKSIGDVAKELDLTETSVRNWVKQAGVDARRDPHGPLTSEERAELALGALDPPPSRDTRGSVFVPGGRSTLPGESS